MGCPAHRQKQLMQVSMLRACEYKQAPEHMVGYASDNNDFDCFFFFFYLGLFIYKHLANLPQNASDRLMVKTLKYEGCC